MPVSEYLVQAFGHLLSSLKLVEEQYLRTVDAGEMLSGNLMG